MNQTTFVTDSDKTPLIKVITWFLLATSVLSVIARAFTKAAVIHKRSLDDYLVPVALVSCYILHCLGRFDSNNIEC